MSIWFIVGIGLVLWVLWDLWNGYTYLWEPVTRDENPGLYWTVITIWSAAAVTSFFMA